MMDKAVDVWYRALLDRAVELNQRPADVVAEFLPLITEPPPSIKRAEAKALAQDYPFGADELMETFRMPT